MKAYHTTTNVGKAKYLVSHHDGVKTHKDGSPFFDLSIFRNKKKLKVFIDKLNADNYVEQLPTIYL